MLNPPLCKQSFQFLFRNLISLVTIIFPRYTFLMHRFSGLELRKISVNTVVQFLVRLMTSLATLITTLLITYFLGLESVGSFTKVIAFVGIFYIFIDFGFNSVLLRHYFKNVGDQIGNLVSLRLLISFLLLPIVIIISLLLPHDTLSGTGFSGVEKNAIIIFSLTLVSLSLLNSLNAFLQKRLDYSLSLLPTFAGNVILIAIVLYAVYIGNFYFLMTAYIFSGATNAILTYLQIRNKYKLSLQLKTFKTFSKVMLLTSWPLGIMLFLNLLYSRADVFILAFLKPTGDVGTYGISYRFFEIALALPTFLANSTYPVLLKVSEKKKEYLLVFMKYLKLYSILSFVVMMSVILFSPLIRVLGEDFSKSIFPLQILSLSLPFFFATSLLQWHFLIKRKLFFLVPLYGSILVVNIFLNFNFIPKYSYIAAAAITGISEGLVLAVMLWYFYRSKFT